LHLSACFGEITTEASSGATQFATGRRHSVHPPDFCLRTATNVYGHHLKDNTLLLVLMQNLSRFLILTINELTVQRPKLIYIVLQMRSLSHREEIIAAI
jgi:hypothetical protein